MLVLLFYVFYNKKDTRKHKYSNNVKIEKTGSGFTGTATD